MYLSAIARIPGSRGSLDEDELRMVALLGRSDGQAEPLAPARGRRQRGPARRTPGQTLAPAMVAGRRRGRNRGGGRDRYGIARLAGIPSLLTLMAVLETLITARVQCVLQVILLLRLSILLLVVLLLVGAVVTAAAAALLPLLYWVTGQGGVAGGRRLGGGGAGNRVLNESLQVATHCDAIACGRNHSKK